MVDCQHSRVVRYRWPRTGHLVWGCGSPMAPPAACQGSRAGVHTPCEGAGPGGGAEGGDPEGEMERSLA